MVQAILCCRAHRKAVHSYDTGTPTKDESDLLDQVDKWRRAENGDC